MALTPGSTIGPYQILATLGVGGMGEVYRASDPRLGRDVAIKVLPEAFTHDPDRMARFEREARILASITHPNIAAIYGLEDRAGQRALVLELVEGETLADHLASRGALSVEKALALARQIAEGLDAAHERGVVHRDLKPLNIKVTADGQVKVLDFGIAKAAGDLRPDVSSGPTVADTREGVVVGTAAYMSPEQARGQAVDKRTDVWAFGCVLYEMLTGQAAFRAPTASDTIARILGADPDWSALPAGTPAGVGRLLRRCLEKDLKRRLRDLGDLDLALEDTRPAGAGRSRRPSLVWWTVLAASVLAAIAVTRLAVRSGERPSVLPIRFEAPVPVRFSDAGQFAVSPDGRRLAFPGVGSDGVMRLWVRSIDSFETRPVNGTDGEPAYNTSLFWSADSRTIAFYADQKVKAIDSNGGVVQVLCDVPGVAIGGAWSAGNVVVIGSSGSGLLRCSGGEPTPVTARGPDPSALHLIPSFLPDGRHLIYLHVSRANPADNGIRIADLDRPPHEQETGRLFPVGFGVLYVPAADGPGRILFVRDHAVWSVPFDADRRSVAGEPVQIASPVGSFLDSAFFSASPDVLVYRGDVPDVRLEWRGRDGAVLGAVGGAGSIVGVALSPDGTRAATLRDNRQNRADRDVWLTDLTRDTTTRLTSEPLLESVPAWSPDGTALLFARGHGLGDLWTLPIAGGSGRLVLASDAARGPRVNPLLAALGPSPDGRFVVFSSEGTGRTRSDLWVLSLTDGKAVPLIQQEFLQTHPAVSPNGAWLAYVSDETGINEVFVRPLTTDPDSGLPAVGAAALVSRGGGTAPRWRGDGRELFYQSLQGGVMAVNASAGFADKPVELFRAPGLLASWGVTRDGQRFLVAVAVDRTQAPFRFVLNWRAAAR
ncbi:MAG: protein kinase domain-containing protein [Acidobacteriota bacterium]